MAEAKFATPRPGTASPPPNCAICLGSCTNKCYSDSCMHEFCFKCLLEWSKIKAECPLCKQSFKSIIHNIKSNSEYDEHVVETVTVDNASLSYLLPATPQALHQYHFRTTFTVDTHGEHAIQQMLLSHPLLTTLGSVGTYNPDRYTHRRRRGGDTSTSFRRSIYNQNLWVYSPPDITGMYRDVSPAYYRNNPASRTRLVPWLNRELNALLYENTQHVMHLVDIIMDHLLRHHICNPVFRTLLNEYLGHKTDHFIHEFYNFMRSPFDMIGYDRHVVYSERPSPTPLIDISDYDSDVIFVTPTNSNNSDSSGGGRPEAAVRTDPVVIDLLDSDSDVPVIVSEEPSTRSSTAIAPSVAPTNSSNGATTIIESTPEEAARKTVLPLKLRIKLCRNSREKNKRRRWYRVQSQPPFSSSGSSSISDSAISDTSDEGHVKRSSRGHHRHSNHRKPARSKISKSKKRRRLSDNDGIEEDNVTEDDLPLSTFAATSTSTTASSATSSSSKWKKSKHHSKDNKSKKHSHSKKMKSEAFEPAEESRHNSSPRADVKRESDCSDDSLYNDRKPNVRSRVKDVSKDKAGPSTGRSRLKGVFRREDMGNLWYSRPCAFDYSSDSSS